MITIENIQVTGWEPAIRGMRNPMNSWDRSDSLICGYINCPDVIIGENDLSLMEKLADGGSVHAKYRRMIAVYMDITAPLYWWKEFDTYKVGTVANSCSTMHKIHAKEFTLDDFSHDHLDDSHGTQILLDTIDFLNEHRKWFNTEKDPAIKKNHWWNMIQMLPSSYNQKRTVMLNYEVLSHIYYYRKDHKLDEWRTFCSMIRDLPYASDIIIRK